MSKKQENKVEKIQLAQHTHAEVNKEKGTVNIVKEVETSGADNVEMIELFSEQMGIPIFKGEVEHAYESDFLGYTNECPRCKSPTQNMISNFAYATQGHGRLMSGPAGFFCTHCPTVIIADDIVKSAVTKPNKYHGVYTVETGYTDQSRLFKTLNGKKTVYILDEDQNVGGIVQSVHQPNDAVYMDPNVYNKLNRTTTPNQSTTPQQQRKKSTNKRKNKAARKARRRNRKR